MTDEMQGAATIQTVLAGVPLPAARDELVAYARREDEHAAARLEAIPDREYASLDEVGEELARVQPDLPQAASGTPGEESGEPPGRDDYTNPHPEPGEPRRERSEQAHEAIEKATQLQKEQKAKEDGP